MNEMVATTSDDQTGGSRGTTSEAHLGMLSTTSRERSPLHVYLSRLSEGSRPTMSEALSTVARIASGGRLEAHQLPWHELRYQHVQAIRTALTGSVVQRTGKPLSPATINKTLSALRGVLREAWRLGLMTAEDLARAVDVEPVKGSRPLQGRALAHHEVVALFDACGRDESPAGTRDAVILALGLGAGLRRAEIVGLQVSDVKLDQEIIRVLGKGKKVREVPIKGGVLEAIRRWLLIRGEEAGPLLVAVRKGGRLGTEGLAPQAIMRVCEKRGREAGVFDFAAHDLRRTYISVLLDRGVDLSVASDLAGHSSPSTTKRYDRRGERAKHSAAEVVSVPLGRARVADSEERLEADADSEAGIHSAG